jgi:glycopeptide antibiotics resistance protein
MKKDRRTRIIRLIFYIYLVLIFLLVGVKFHGSIAELKIRVEHAQHIVQGGELSYIFNPYPFRTILRQVRALPKIWAIENLLVNAAAFIPYGILLPLSYASFRGLWKTMLVGVLSILFIETFQMVTCLGTFDVDDILLNSLGILIGWFISRHVIRRNML